MKRIILNWKRLLVRLAILICVPSVFGVRADAPHDYLTRGAVVASVRDTALSTTSWCLQEAKDMGLEAVVVPLGWDALEPASWQFRWDELDDITTQAASYGLKVILRVYNTPSCYRPSGSDPTHPPEDPYAMERFMWRMTRHMNFEGRSQHVLGYVIWNEPNIPGQWGGQAASAWDYVQLLAAARRGVIRGDPDAVLVSAALAPTETGNGAMNDLEYLDELYRWGFQYHVDVVGLNGLGFSHDPDHDSGQADYNFMRLKYLHDVMVANGDTSRKVWALEVGWLRDSESDMGTAFNSFKVSTADQSQYIDRAFQKAADEWSWMELMAVWNIGFSEYYPPTSNFYWYDIAQRPYYDYLPVIVKEYSPSVIPPPLDKPDLVIRDLEVEDGNTNPDVGETITIRLRIKNQGSATAKNIVTSWFPFGADGGHRQDFTVDSLDPGQDYDQYWKGVIYKTAEEFITVAKVDYDNRVDESNEDNNTATLVITVHD